MTAALPSSWQHITHKDQIYPCYVHKASRVVSWTRPYTIDKPGDLESHRTPDDATPPSGLLEAIEDMGVQEREKQRRLAAIRPPQPQPETHKPDYQQHRAAQELERELNSLPPMTLAEFRARPLEDQQRLALSKSMIPQLVLREFSSCVLGSTAQLDVALATDGPWAHPPHRCTVRILGVIVAEALNSSKDYAKALAAEEALLVLCPSLYQEELQRLGYRVPRVIRRVITDLSAPSRLGIDDYEVLDLDLCVGKTPAMLKDEYIVKHYGQTMPQQATRELQPRGFEHSISIGGKTYTAMDKSQKSAKQKACLALLKETHPHVSTWQGLLDEYPSDYTAQDGGARELPARSAEAEALLKEEEERQVPGEGSNFAYNWRRQAELEEARRRAPEGAAALTSDFASDFDKQREVADEGKLERLRAAVKALESATDDGLEPFVAASGVMWNKAAREAEEDVQTKLERREEGELLQPTWLAGTKMNAKLMEIAIASAALRS